MNATVGVSSRGMPHLRRITSDASMRQRITVYNEVNRNCDHRPLLLIRAFGSAPFLSSHDAITRWPLFAAQYIEGVPAQIDRQAN
jgi:hypothetical protein